MRYILALALCASLYAQTPTPGSAAVVNGTPAAAAVPTKLTLSTPDVICTITGNTFPATQLLVSCNINQIGTVSYTFPESEAMPPNSNYTFSQGFGTDQATVIAKADASGHITVQGAANGTQASTTIAGATVTAIPF